MRIVCQFSCGAASAVATKLAIAQYGQTHDVQIVNAFIKQQEHDDNRRFLTDCQRWFGRQIVQLRDEKYGADIIQVFRQDELDPGSWFLRYRSGPSIRERFPLCDLPDGSIKRDEALHACSFFCELAEQNYTG